MNKNFYLKILVSLIVLLSVFVSNAQDPKRFEEQVDRLAKIEYDFSSNKELVVFTGSSSVRMWKDVQARFPKYNIINNGFGGSHFSDLLHFYDVLILKYSPDILFVYEGDNDVAAGKKVSKIYKDAKVLVKKLQNDLPQTKVVFISPKPSIKRWHLKKQYNKINKKLKKLSKKTDNFEFADVWSSMLDENGNVYRDVFIHDDLHMNEKGYDLWTKVIGEFLN